MKWFKHDSDAHRDAKMRRLIHKWGIEAYGLYWYCLEQIASEVTAKKLTFELEHDAEIIAHDMRMSREKVEEMMLYMVDLGLFENAQGRITCLKLFNRIDLSQGGSKAFREAVAVKRNEVNSGQSHDSVMTQSCNSHDSVMTKSCLDVDVDLDIDISKDLTLSPKADNATPFQKIIQIYHEKLPDLPSVKRVNNSRRAAMRQRHKGIMESDLGNWAGYFGAVSQSDFLMGRIPGKDWRANFDFLLTDKATTGVLEGKYS